MMFEAAESEFAALKASIVDLAQVVSGLSQTVTAQNAVLVDLRRQIAEGNAPSPTPAPAPPTSADRDEAAIRAVITDEMDRRTTHVLTESQMAAWVAYFLKPEFASLPAADFRAAVAAQVEEDIAKYGFPRRALVLTGTAGMP